MDVATELEKLQQLRQSGAISADEYERAKARLLDAQPKSASGLLGGDAESRARQWAMILHLSLLAGFVGPFGGFIAPVLIWQLKKDEYPAIDEHGKNAVNWIISAVIYGLGSAILCFVFVGFLLLLILGVVAVAFPLIAGIKANSGEVWKYPGAIGFFK
jgi:uncharacterized protein